MCGITGIFNQYNQRVRATELRAIVERMTTTLKSRGPDAHGHIICENVAFGHRRLSVLDLTESGAQPMQDLATGTMLTYNGEVYNYRELRSELETAGFEFKGASDTEVILKAYCYWGLRGLRRLEGIFALGLWDPRQHRFVLMRDRFGVKPLFYGESPMGILFGSEIKAVLAAGVVDRSLDEQAFREYVWYGNTYGCRTFYKGVSALKPGHWLIVEHGQQQVGAWWQIEEWLEGGPACRSFAEAVEITRSALDGAVARQMVADVPVAVFLSGGLDSSAIAASAVRSIDRPLLSFSVGFDYEGGVNELPKARVVASHLGLDHHEIVVGGTNLVDVVSNLASVHDEPFADAANIPLHLMCKALNGKAKVVLQGDGGDEIFGGYRRYSLLRNSHFWRLIPKNIVKLGSHFGTSGKRFSRLADTIGNHDAAMRMALLLTTEVESFPPEIVFKDSWRHHLEAQTDPFLAYREAAARFSNYDSVQKMLLTDLTVQMPSQFLTKVDRATMSVGVESRVPMLDEGLARIIVGMPAKWKVAGMQKKIILRQSQRGRIPDSILDGPKTGFGVPYKHWIKTSLFEFTRERLLDNKFIERFNIIPQAIEKMIDQNKNNSYDHGYLIWKLLNLQIWYGLQKL